MIEIIALNQCTGDCRISLSVLMILAPLVFILRIEGTTALLSLKEVQYRSQAFPIFILPAHRFFV